MNIVFLSYLHGFGGAERQNVMLANEMAQRGHNVFLVSIGVESDCYELSSKVVYTFLPDRKTGVSRILTRYTDIKSFLRKIKPDLTVTFWFQAAYLTAMMSKKLTGKIVYSERGDPGDKEYSGCLGIIRKLITPRIDGYVFQSKGAQNFFNEKVQRRSTIIPNPVYVKRSDHPQIGCRRKVIVTVGRLHDQKNHRLLIDSFSKIAFNYPEYNLEIYGDGILRPVLEKQIESLGLTQRVLLLGTYKSIHEKIFDASLFVLSSDFEGLPNILIEAMALGIPCISTDCRPGGAREIICDGEDGLIVPVGDSETLALSMEYLLTTTKHAEKLATAAMKKIKKFDAKIIYDKWEEYFYSVMEKK